MSCHCEHLILFLFLLWPLTGQHHPILIRNPVRGYLLLPQHEQMQFLGQDCCIHQPQNLDFDKGNILTMTLSWLVKKTEKLTSTLSLFDSLTATASGGLFVASWGRGNGSNNAEGSPYSRTFMQWADVYNSMSPV